MNGLAWQMPWWLFISIIVVRLVRAPYMIAKADAKQIADLSTLSAETADRRVKIDYLWALRKSGVELRNTTVSDGNLVSWLEKTNAWRNDIYEAAGAVSMDLKNHLETLNEVGPSPMTNTTSGVLRLKNPLHSHMVGIISEILRRLEKYLEKEI